MAIGARRRPKQRVRAPPPVMLGLERGIQATAFGGYPEDFGDGRADIPAELIVFFGICGL